MSADDAVHDAPAHTMYESVTITEMLKWPRPVWRIKNLLPQMGIAFVYGASKSGKTFLVLDLAMAICRGETWFKYKTRKAPVFYVPLEAGAGIRNRVAAWVKRNPKSDTSNFHLVRDARFSLDDGLNTDGMAELVLREGGPGSVIILDTFARATTGMDENSAEKMGVAISAADSLAQRTKGLVILVHHTGKDGSKGARGSSALLGAADAMIEVVRSDAGARVWKSDKVKEGQDGATHSFTLERECLYTDDDGDEVGSCVVRPDPEADEAKKTEAQARGKNQRAILDAIKHAFRTASFGLEGAPPDAAALFVKQAEYLGAEALEAIGKKERCPEVARSVIKDLVKKGTLHQAGGGLTGRQTVLWMTPT